MSFYDRAGILKIVTMDAIQTLESRSNNDIIESAFIENILKEEAEGIKQDQDRVISRFSSNDPVIDLIDYSRTFRVTEDKITLTHHIQERFRDMKRTRYGRQKSLKIHNTILYRHLNRIIYRLNYDLTDAVKSRIAKEHNINL